MAHRPPHLNSLRDEVADDPAWRGSPRLPFPCQLLRLGYLRGHSRECYEYLVVGNTSRSRSIFTPSFPYVFRACVLRTLTECTDGKLRAIGDRAGLNQRCPHFRSLILSRNPSRAANGRKPNDPGIHRETPKHGPMPGDPRPMSTRTR